MLGENITEARELLNISKSELARRTGVSSSYISYLEKSKESNPSLNVISEIAKALNITKEQLIGDSGESIEGTIVVDYKSIDVVVRIEYGSIVAHTKKGQDVSKLKRYIEFTSDLEEV